MVVFVRACYCGQHLASAGVVEVHLMVLLEGREVFSNCGNVEAVCHFGGTGSSIPVLLVDRLGEVFRVDSMWCEVTKPTSVSAHIHTTSTTE